MKYRTSWEVEFVILAALAANKEMAQYDFKKLIKKDYHTILRHLRRLEYLSLIDLARLEPPSRGGYQRKVYSLTVQGLVAFLQIARPELDPGDMSIIAKNYPGMLPLILGKWSFWEAKGLQQTILSRLNKALEDVPNKLLFSEPDSTKNAVKNKPMADGDIISLFSRIYGEEKAGGHFKELKEAREQLEVSLAKITEYRITKKTLFDWAPLESDMFQNFLRVVVEDPDLKEFFTSCFKESEQEYMTYLGNIRSWKAFWKGLRRQEPKD